LVDERLYLPEQWTADSSRCEQAGVPEAFRGFKTKVALALERLAHQRRIGVRFSWVGADGFYGNDPAFLRGVAAIGVERLASIRSHYAKQGLALLE
jgi:SRSO17 transposase